ncbi:ATP-binding protein [Streptomyces shaanxiensis]|uniref:NB-ARC domain-containing protein n=1 Tax=Streptomyces shaanxiensis TaxID=653357 RepID=A0ABP7WK77_9ACTN
MAITGDGAQVVMLLAEAVRWAREVEAPSGAGNLPGSASGVFVGREGELAELRRLLDDEGEAAVTQVSRTWAIHGMGGIGKSTLALHYAHTHMRTYMLVWWINAASRPGRHQSGHPGHAAVPAVGCNHGRAGTGGVGDPVAAVAVNAGPVCSPSSTTSARRPGANAP